MEAWITPLISILGSVGGGYLGVRISVAKLEQRMESIIDRLEKIEEEINKRVRDRLHDHNDSILKLDGRVTRLEAKRTR